MRILIVDDDADNLASLSDVLADRGFDVETAIDGFVAMEKLACIDGHADPFDLCLIDFKMPGMDGVELFEKIVAQEPSTRVIMITAYAGADGIKRAQAAGTWKVLRKPVDVDKLLAMIDEAGATPR